MAAPRAGRGGHGLVPPGPGAHVRRQMIPPSDSGIARDAGRRRDDGGGSVGPALAGAGPRNLADLPIGNLRWCQAGCLRGAVPAQVRTQPLLGGTDVHEGGGLGETGVAGGQRLVDRLVLDQSAVGRVVVDQSAPDTCA